MSIDYTVSVAFGFPPPPAPEGYEYEWEWWEEATPPGFHFVHGGDLASGNDEGVIFGLPQHIKEVFWSRRSDYFGAFKLDNFIEVTDEDRDKVIDAARHLGVDDHEVGYYVVSSVG